MHKITVEKSTALKTLTISFSEEQRKIPWCVLKIKKDFSENIDKIFSQNEVSLTYIFFPDPWDKKINQAENKLLKKTFLDNLHKITKK